MSVKSLFDSLTGFLGKYADEAEAAGNVLEGIVSALPLNAQTRATLAKEIDKLTNAPKNIRNWLANATDPGVSGGAVDPAAINSAVAAYLGAHPVKAPDVKIDKAVVNSAVANYFASPAGKAALAAAVKAATPDSGS